MDDNKRELKQVETAREKSQISAATIHVFQKYSQQLPQAMENQMSDQAVA
jgi:hypothetical protein